MSLLSVNNLVTALLVLTLLMVGNRLLGRAVRLLALQGLALGGLAIVVGLQTGEKHLFVAAGLTFLVKALAVPRILATIIRGLGIDREGDSFVPPGLSLALAALFTILSYYIAKSFPAGSQVHTEALAVSITMVLSGLLLMVTRKVLLTQVFGVMLMENGLYLTALAMTSGMPLMVELGIFFDLLVGVIVMKVFTERIKEAFQTVDTDRLNTLKG